MRRGAGGTPPVQEITLLLKKPEAPMNAVFDYAGVEITPKTEEG